ncbi:hypothetical protein LIA77_02273 [Sarocladium implicatum]|nr:hypothetical protein LIA77_02273 [Sarocladium implicatum]
MTESITHALLLSLGELTFIDVIVIMFRQRALTAANLNKHVTDKKLPYLLSASSSLRSRVDRPAHSCLECRKSRLQDCHTRSKSCPHSAHCPSCFRTASEITIECLLGEDSISIRMIGETPKSDP